MRHATYRTRIAITCAVIPALLMASVARISAAPQSKSLNQQEVIELLEGGVPSSRVTEIVDDRGINFDFTREVEQKVRQAGGADDVVAALRRASDRHAQSERPRTGGLVLKTTPGETQIYLNDELKGMTSPEGEIRITDLQPATYTLRVSLLGYQSYEKPMTVAAGEDQTVYVTLVQKGRATTPQDNPTTPSRTPVTTSPAGIPVLGVSVAGVQFFEGPHDLTLEKSQRVYRYSFDRSTARSIFWELSLRFPTPKSRTNFQVDAVWFRPDGSEMFRQSLNAYVQPPWGSSWHTLGYGWADSGHWQPGVYRVELSCQGSRIGTGTFQVN